MSGRQLTACHTTLKSEPSFSYGKQIMFNERQLNWILAVKKQIYLQGFQANKARNSESINDVFLAGHRLSLPPSWRPLSSKTGPAFSTTGTQDTVCPASLPIGAWGQGCGPLRGQVHSPPPPLPVALWTGPSALPESSASARALHLRTTPLFLTPVRPKALYSSPGPVADTEPQIKHHNTGPRREPC